MLKLLESSHDILKDKYELTLKPHPATPVKINDYPILKLTISNGNLDKLFPEYQGIICSIYTSVSVEAVAMGLPVITILDNNELNYSALYNVQNTSFVSTKSELEEALINQYDKKKKINNNNIYFWTSKKLPRWSKLLEIN